MPTGMQSHLALQLPFNMTLRAMSKPGLTFTCINPNRAQFPKYQLLCRLLQKFQRLPANVFAVGNYIDAFSF